MYRAISAKLEKHDFQNKTFDNEQIFDQMWTQQQCFRDNSYF